MDLIDEEIGAAALVKRIRHLKQRMRCKIQMISAHIQCPAIGMSIANPLQEERSFAYTARANQGLHAIIPIDSIVLIPLKRKISVVKLVLHVLIKRFHLNPLLFEL